MSPPSNDTLLIDGPTPGNPFGFKLTPATSSTEDSQIYGEEVIRTIVDIRIYKGVCLCTYTYYCTVGSFCEVRISCSSQFDPIYKSLFTKLLISRHKRDYQHANCKSYTAKCLFECEIVKYSSTKFSAIWYICTYILICGVLWVQM